jgi:hemoglobin-like flavoprotein
MSPQQIALVQHSWRSLRDLDPQLVGDLFYSKLFLDRPEVRAMFPQDMSEQHSKLVSKFNLVVARLHHFEDLKTEIAALARRHVDYGTKPQHYPLVGAALLWTLERVLGDDWTPAVAEAWQTCYALLSKTMIQAAENQ